MHENRNKREPIEESKIYAELPSTKIRNLNEQTLFRRVKKPRFHSEATTNRENLRKTGKGSTHQLQEKRLLLLRQRKTCGSELRELELSSVD